MKVEIFETHYFSKNWYEGQKDEVIRGEGMKHIKKVSLQNIEKKS